MADQGPQHQGQAHLPASIHPSGAGLGEGHSDSPKTRNDLAWVIEYQGRCREAEQMCRQLLTDTQQFLGEEDPLTLTARRHLAWLIGVRGNYNEAEKRYLQLIADRWLIVGDEHPATLTILQGLAWVVGLRAVTPRQSSTRLGKGWPADTERDTSPSRLS